MPVINATFETRRDAELAIEHLVQEHEFDRDDIVVGPDGDENSVGTKPSGADIDTDGDDSDEDDAELNGSIAVAVTVDSEELAETVRELLEEFGGGDVTIEG